MTDNTNRFCDICMPLFYLSNCYLFVSSKKIKANITLLTYKILHMISAIIFNKQLIIKSKQTKRIPRVLSGLLLKVNKTVAQV